MRGLLFTVAKKKFGYVSQKIFTVVVRRRTNKVIIVFVLS